MPDPTTEAAVVRDLAKAAFRGPEVITVVEGHHLGVAIPDGYTLEGVDLDRLAPHPVRATGTARFDDPDSFVHYVMRVDSTEAGYYGDADRLRIVAVLNDHVIDRAGWRDFRAELCFKETPEWAAWTAFDTKLVPATRFAEFLEQWQHTVLAPTAGELRDLVTSFRAVKSVTFGDEIRDQNGDRSLQWTEQTTGGSSRTGAIDIPETLTIELAPFVGSEPTELTARFRYRVDAGGATFGVVLVQPDRVIRDAFENETREIGERVGSPVMLGTPAEG